jgi:hypothetical protein
MNGRKEMFQKIERVRNVAVVDGLWSHLRSTIISSIKSLKMASASQIAWWEPRASTTAQVKNQAKAVVFLSKT